MNKKFTDIQKQEICDNIDISKINIDIDKPGYLYIGEISNNYNRYKIGTSIICPDINHDINQNINYRSLKIYKTKYYKILEKIIIDILDNYNIHQHILHCFDIDEDILIDLIEYLYNFYEILPDDLLENLPIR